MTCAARRRRRLQRPRPLAPAPLEWTIEAPAGPPPAAAAEETTAPAPAPAAGELVLDGDGRVAVAGADALDYGYRTFDGVTSGRALAALRADCGAAFSVRMRKGDAAYSAGSTYWVPRPRGATRCRPWNARF